MEAWTGVAPPREPGGRSRTRVPSDQYEDLEGFDAFYRACSPDLLRFLHARLRSVPDAQELAQEAFTRVLEHSCRLGAHRRRAYLFQVARNAAIDLLRRRRRQDWLAEHNGPEPAQEALQSRAAEAREDLALVATALADLPEACRTAFVLSREQGLSSREIAVHLAVTDRMVRLHLARALSHLRAALRHDEAAGAPAAPRLDAPRPRISADAKTRKWPCAN